VRICSLLPSATEIAFALGLGDSVVAVTHECDYPFAATKLPRITRTPIHNEMNSRDIDAAVMASVAQGESLYRIDMDLMRELAPDLILTQQLCEVCAVSMGEVQRALKGLPSQPRVVNLEPRSLDGIIENIFDVAAETGANATAAVLVADLRMRIERIRRQAATLQRPRVFCMEWADPVFCGGHWMKELVEIAGGRDDLSLLHRPSTRIEWQQVVEFAPEVLVLTCCGFDVTRMRREVEVLAANTSVTPGFRELPAVRAGRVYVTNAMAYFSRPGPRIVDSLEILAHLIHPQVFADPGYPDAFAHIPTVARAAGRSL
jgi:iron complex transport system substrate-binding protein